jgi:vacuolar-type H+-ATPase subunit I/STV1
MHRARALKTELIIGVIFVFTGWLLALLMVVYDIPYRIEISMLGYILSIMGLILSTYGIASMLSTKQRSQSST